MNKSRQTLVGKAADPETPEDRVKAALRAIMDKDEISPEIDRSLFLSEKDAMLELGRCSRSTIWNYRKNLGLRSWKIGKGRRLYSKEEIQKFVERVGSA